MTDFSADSHPGHKRGHNEDCYHADAGQGLWLVADGVGGHANGEVASAIVRDTLVSDIAAGSNLIEAIRHAHREVLREIAARPASNMGSTVVALLLDGDAYEVAWVGDSRAYLFDGDVRQITRDHNPVSEMLARGAITPEQAAHHPERNVLTQSLGVSDSITVNPERVRGELRPGQQLLMCSDGLTDELDDATIAALMRDNATPAEQVRALIKAALDAGGRDNITVIVVGDRAPAGSGLETAGKPQRTLELERPPEPGSANRSHDRAAWIVLAALVVLALLWVLL